MDDKKNQNPSFQVSVDAEQLGGQYANFAAIAHSASEFVIDFISVLPNTKDQARLQARIVLAPTHAKSLLRALQENIRRYEETHGPIDNGDGQGPSYPMNFMPPGQA